MENASKALLMSASILIGVIIISIAVYLFTAFGGTSKEIQQQVDARVIEEFNNNFLKYQGNIRCTIHDIVNLAKFAQKTNEQMDINSSNDFYIHVILKNKDLTTECTTEEDWTKQLSENSVESYTDENGNPTADIQYYTCKKVYFDNPRQKNRVSGILFEKTPRSQLGEN